MTYRPVGSGSEVRRAHERIGIVDVDVSGSCAVGRLDQRDRELAVGGLARDQQVVAATERNPDLDDGIRIASELFRRQ